MRVASFIKTAPALSYKQYTLFLRVFMNVMNNIPIVIGEPELIVSLPYDIKACHRPFLSALVVDHEVGMMVGETIQFQIMAKFPDTNEFGFMVLAMTRTLMVCQTSTFSVDGSVVALLQLFSGTPRSVRVSA